MIGRFPCKLLAWHIQLCFYIKFLKPFRGTPSTTKVKALSNRLKCNRFLREPCPSRQVFSEQLPEKHIDCDKTAEIDYFFNLIFVCYNSFRKKFILDQNTNTKLRILIVQRQHLSMANLILLVWLL